MHTVSNNLPDIFIFQLFFVAMKENTQFIMVKILHSIFNTIFQCLNIQFFFNAFSNSFKQNKEVISTTILIWHRYYRLLDSQIDFSLPHLQKY